MEIEFLAAKFTLPDPDGNPQVNPNVASFAIPAGKTGRVSFSISAGYENVMIVLEALANGTYSEIMRYGTYYWHIRNIGAQLLGGKTYLFASWEKDAYGGGSGVPWVPCKAMRVDTLQQDVSYRFGAEDGVDNDFNDIVAVLTLSVQSAVSTKGKRKTAKPKQRNRRA